MSGTTPMTEDDYCDVCGRSTFAFQFECICEDIDD